MKRGVRKGGWGLRAAVEGEKHGYFCIMLPSTKLGLSILTQNLHTQRGHPKTASFPIGFIISEEIRLRSAGRKLERHRKSTLSEPGSAAIHLPVLKRY